jgi:hypothetical protein
VWGLLAWTRTTPARPSSPASTASQCLAGARARSLLLLSSRPVAIAVSFLSKHARTCAQMKSTLGLTLWQPGATACQVRQRPDPAPHQAHRPFRPAPRECLLLPMFSPMFLLCSASLSVRTLVRADSARQESGYFADFEDAHFFEESLVPEALVSLHTPRGACVPFFF